MSKGRCVLFGELLNFHTPHKIFLSFICGALVADSLADALTSKLYRSIFFGRTLNIWLPRSFSLFKATFNRDLNFFPFMIVTPLRIDQLTSIFPRNNKPNEPLGKFRKLYSLIWARINLRII